jgi:transposase
MRAYTKDFKADALAMLRRGDRSCRQIAADLGVNYWTMREWATADKMARKKAKRPKKSVPEGGSAQETAEQRVDRLERENKRLRKQVDQLEEDRAILKKAAAFFAKESE